MGIHWAGPLVQIVSHILRNSKNLFFQTDVYSTKIFLTPQTKDFPGLSLLRFWGNTVCSGNSPRGSSIAATCSPTALRYSSHGVSSFLASGWAEAAWLPPALLVDASAVGPRSWPDASIGLMQRSATQYPIHLRIHLRHWGGMVLGSQCGDGGCPGGGGGMCSWATSPYGGGGGPSAVGGGYGGGGGRPWGGGGGNPWGGGGGGGGWWWWWCLWRPWRPCLTGFPVSWKHGAYQSTI